MSNQVLYHRLPDVTQDAYIFICGNRRDGRKACGNELEIKTLCEQFKQTIQCNRHLFQAGRILKVHQTGCLGHCASGPNIVIFPENIWYHYTTPEDVNVIVREHLIQGKVVSQLVAKPL